MKNIARLPTADRRALFTNTASKTGLTVAIIEKDFWVCWTLDYLFHLCPWRERLAFKGGTSLSKAYELIERFSEDLDLILDWRVLGYGADEPWELRSNTQQSRFNEEAGDKTATFLRDEFVPALKVDFFKDLEAPIQIVPDSEDGQAILFTYPQEFADRTITQEIRLEIGALAAWTPAERQVIASFAAKHYRHVFQEPETCVLTVLPERTFWEKITILHREANRSENSAMPSRYSRHYYDLYCMSDSWVKNRAFADIDLLKRVVAFKDKFYRSPWAGYEYAKPGAMKLMPPEHSLASLEEDYEHMQSMIFGKKPDFKELMDGIRILETEINSIYL
jgi:hypothetical protein